MFTDLDETLEKSLPQSSLLIQGEAPSSPGGKQAHPLRKYVTYGEFNGFQVQDKRRASHQARLLRPIPSWVQNDRRIQDLLLKMFPRMRDRRTKHYKSAKRWAPIIYLYFRNGQSATEIGEALGIPSKLVKKALYRIRKAAAGFRTTGKPRTRRTKS